MRDLARIFELLCEFELCSNQTEFSRDWLGRSKGYYAYLRCTGAAPNTASLGMLSARILNVSMRVAGKMSHADRKRLLKAAVAAALMMMPERAEDSSQKHLHRD